MIQHPSYEELEHRVERELRHFHGAMPERDALVWHGYLAALIEWGAISVEQHETLSRMLPRIDDNPVLAVLLGRQEDS